MTPCRVWIPSLIDFTRSISPLLGINIECFFAVENGQWVYRPKLDRFFFDVVFGVHEGMGEFTIIGYQNETFTHKIKTSICRPVFNLRGDRERWCVRWDRVRKMTLGGLLRRG